MEGIGMPQSPDLVLSFNVPLSHVKRVMSLPARPRASVGVWRVITVIVSPVDTMFSDDRRPCAEEVSPGDATMYGWEMNRTWLLAIEDTLYSLRRKLLSMETVVRARL